MPQKLFARALIFAPLAALAATFNLAETTAPAPKPSPQAIENYGRIPLGFEANQGQADPRVKFQAHGQGYGIFLTGSEAVLSLSKPEGKSGPPDARVPHGKNLPHEWKFLTDAIRLELPGARKGIAPGGEDRLPGTANYFIGNDPARWHPGVPAYARVRYARVFQGVDLVYYGNQRQLEYDFVVAPHADAAQIALRFSGARSLALTASGDLTVTAAHGAIAFHKPEVYQTVNGRRNPIDGAFTLAANRTVRFRLGSYDHSQPLTIDPVLVYSTYLGGSGGEEALALALDAAGNAYIAGATWSSDFPVTPAALQSTNKAYSKQGFNAFITKLNPQGTALVYSTYLGGSGTGYYGDAAAALALDASGNAYLTGYTYSTDFPVTSGAFQTKNRSHAGYGSNAFVTKLNPQGTALVYSTYLGGSGSQFGDGASALVLDASGDAYLAGGTYSTDFPVTPGAFQTTNKAYANNSGSNAFVTKLNPQGTALVYSTYLGGSGGETNGGDTASALAIDASGDIYLTGQTGSSDFPVTAGAFQTTNKAPVNNGYNGFVVKLNPQGSALVYSTYLGGSVVDYASAIALDASGDAYLAGYALSSDFPVTLGAFQTTNKASENENFSGFVTKLNPQGSALVYSTFLGGSGVEYYGAGDSVAALALDASGNAYVVGTADSRDFPVTQCALQITNKAQVKGYTNGFVTKLNPQGTALLYSTYLGGSGSERTGDFALALALDASGDAHMVGAAGSIDFPVTPGAFQTTNKVPVNDGSTAFLATFNLADAPTNVASTSTTLTSSASPASAGVPVTFTAKVTASCGLPTGSVTFAVDEKSASTATLGSGGTATYTTTTLAPGTHTITASYAGNAAFDASTSSPLTETILATQTATPTFSPAVGVYTAPQSVTLTDVTNGATIYYTTDGVTTPTINSAKYSTPIAVTTTETIQTFAAAPGLINSAVASGTYTIVPIAAPPVFSLAAGKYTSVQQLTITDATPDATIYYTANGNKPTASSAKYAGPITLDTTETIQAIAIATGYTDSAVKSATYTIAEPAPKLITVSAIVSAQTQTITIQGSSFGVQKPYIGDSSTIKLADVTARWSAGVGTSSEYDSVRLQVVSWTDTQIVLGGFTGAYGRNYWSLYPRDNLRLSIWNPESGQGPAVCANIVVGDGPTVCSPDPLAAGSVSSEQK